MSLSDQINHDLKEAMKVKDTVKLSTLRMVKAAITNLAIEKKKDNLDDSDIMGILQKQVKQRRESFESFTQGGRTEMAEKELQEMKVLEAYLPKQLSEDEIEVLVKAAIAETGVSSKADIGKLMGALMPKVKGKADGKLVNQIVQKHLS